MYKVIDYMYGEILTFKNKREAEEEAQHRVKKYSEGYDIRRNHIRGCDSVYSTYNAKSMAYEIHY